MPPLFHRDLQSAALYPSFRSCLITLRLLHPLAPPSFTSWLSSTASPVAAFIALTTSARRVNSFLLMHEVRPCVYVYKKVVRKLHYKTGNQFLRSRKSNSSARGSLQQEVHRTICKKFYNLDIFTNTKCQTHKHLRNVLMYRPVVFA